MADSFANSVLVAKTQRRMGRIKMTEEDYEQFASKEWVESKTKEINLETLGSFLGSTIIYTPIIPFSNFD